ncbi:MAG TPA: SMR family transporter [Candidatus Berkiella sp.]|nr:SMR family transporter [Candidatus Berkiella sp.]
MVSYLYLALAIIAEVIATSSLKACAEFTILLPSILVVVCYCFAFYFLMLSLRTIPVGVAYAIWSGVGIVIVTLISYFLYRQILDTPALVGIGFIIVGVVIIQALSRSSAH